MKKNNLTAFIFGSVLMMLAACAGDADDVDNAEEVANDPCTEENDVFLQIEKYGYQFDSTYTFNGDFNVLRSEWSQTNDSSAVLNLFNFEQGATTSHDNLTIHVEFHSKNGKSIEAAVYPYSDYSADYWCRATIESSEGTVYFNWNMGMPKQGNVELIHVGDDSACGKFMLSVNKINMTNIGHVELKGNWKTK